MVFKIGDHDYSGKVLMDTFNVNNIEVFTSWEDANGTTHRDIYRHKIQGQFDMMISKLSEYQAFINDIHNQATNGGYVPCKIAVNNYDAENVDADLFIEYTPVRSMNNNYTKGYLSFTVTVEER